jgi:hypothetical protein
MLKIKDNVDLKELEKFGFTFLNKVDHPQKKYCYFISATVNQNGIMIYDDRVIRNVGAESCVLRETNDLLYDLIKADLVEKIEK